MYSFPHNKLKLRYLCFFVMIFKQTISLVLLLQQRYYSYITIPMGKYGFGDSDRKKVSLNICICVHVSSKLSMSK